MDYRFNQVMRKNSSDSTFFIDLEWYLVKYCLKSLKKIEFVYIEPDRKAAFSKMELLNVILCRSSLFKIYFRHSTKFRTSLFWTHYRFRYIRGREGSNTSNIPFTFNKLECFRIESAKYYATSIVNFIFKKKFWGIEYLWIWKCFIRCRRIVSNTKSITQTFENLWHLWHH